MLATLAPLVCATPYSELTLTLVVLAVDISGVAAARRYFTGLASNSASSATPLETRSKNSLSSSAKRRREVDRKASVDDAPWHWLVHAMGMGFGISAVLAVGYLAYLFEF